MKAKVTCCMALLLACIGVCTMQDQGFNSNEVACIQGMDPTFYPLYATEQAFSLNLLSAAVRAAPGQSVFFSPYSIYHALLLTYFASANHTEGYLKRSLGIPDHVTKLQIMQGYQLQRKNLGFRNNKSYEFNSADRLYVAQDVPIRDCIQEVLHEQIHHLDFKSNPAAAREVVNGWVAMETRDHIKDLIPPQGISAATDLVLANAAYFKGRWQSRFDPAHTKREVFYVSPSKQTIVDMMRQEGHFQHFQSETLGAHVLEMPYLGGDISMIILLPPFSNTPLESTLQRLTPSELGLLLSEDAGPHRLVHVRIPRFSVEKSIELKPVLQELGVGDLFESTADLSALAPQGFVHLDDAVHKAKIEVDEDGSVAAAATALFSFRSSRPLEPAQFVCDHPFVYILYDRPLKSILFMGVYRGPNQ